MRKIIALLFLVGLTLGSVNAQVGVDTDTPTEILDVNGKLRVLSLPKNGENINTLPDGTEGTNTFKSTGMVVANDQGVLGVAPSSYGIASVFINSDQGTSPQTSSIIELDGISIRYSINDNWSNPALARIQGTTDTPRQVSMTLPIGGARFNGRQFVDLTTGSWERLAALNYDTEEAGTGLVIDHTNNRMYRYSAYGWKEKINSPGSFCHALERIGEL